MRRATTTSDADSAPTEGENQQAEKMDEEISSLVLWSRPSVTLTYATKEIVHWIHRYLRTFLSYRKTFLFGFVTLLCAVGIHFLDGSHQSRVRPMEHFLLWLVYWFGLGVASSIGLGTGLHTFLLYLGPFIARVTLGAYECGSIQFPHPPYPREIVCPSSLRSNGTSDGDSFDSPSISFWNILWKVKFEAFFWGLGTAFGELPPYFVARAATLIPFEQLIGNGDALSWTEKLRYAVYRLIRRVGFVGILLCASIPNPLFDLAGITCGYFLISFWHFFFATIIGKALIKMSLQTSFIIVLFSEHHAEQLIEWTRALPLVGQFVRQPLKGWFEEQKMQMHRQTSDSPSQRSFLSQSFEYVVLLMIGYFLVSIVNSLAQKHHQRIAHRRKEHDQ